jgi:hypothetical protein
LSKRIHSLSIVYINRWWSWELKILIHVEDERQRINKLRRTPQLGERGRDRWNGGNVIWMWFWFHWDFFWPSPTMFGSGIMFGLCRSEPSSEGIPTHAVSGSSPSPWYVRTYIFFLHVDRCSIWKVETLLN